MWLGGGVAVCAAGVLAVVVFSEATPNDGRPGNRVAAVHADPAADLPDPWLLPRVVQSPPPKLVAVGSVEEARREVRSLTGAGDTPAFDDAPVWFEPRWRGPQWETADAVGVGRSEPANGALVPEGVLSIHPLLAAERDRLWWAGQTVSTLNQVAQGLALRAGGEAEPWDLRVDLSQLGQRPEVGENRTGLGVDQESAWMTPWRDRSARWSVPGPRLASDEPGIAWSPRSRLRAGAFTDLVGSDREFVDLRLLQVWGIGRSSTLSIGLQHLRGVDSNEQPELPLERDSILLELKIGF